MSAEVEALLLRGTPAWHGLGDIFPQDAEITKQDVIVHGGLDWEVELAEIMTNDQVKTAIDDYRVTRRKTDNAILGIVRKGWTPIQNKDAVGVFDQVVHEGHAKYESAGSLRGGSRVFVLAKLPEPLLLLNKKDVVDRFVLLSLSHDGHRPLQMLCTPVRVVCSNTLTMALQVPRAGEEAKWTRFSPRINISHNMDAKFKLKEAGKVMGRALQYYRLFGEFSEHLTKQQVQPHVLKHVIGAVFPANFKQEVTPTIQEHRLAIESLFEAGVGQEIEGVPGTAWALLNAFTEYSSHGYPLRNKKLKTASDRAYAVWMGPGRNLNERAGKVLSQVFA